MDPSEPWLGAQVGVWGSWHPGVPLALQGELSPARQVRLHGPSSSSPTRLQPGAPQGIPLRWHPPDSPLCLPQSRDRKVLRDYSAALSYGSTAKYLNLTALLLNIIIVTLLIALLATGTITMMNVLHQQQEQYPFQRPT
ncbi:PREDICTED: dispanin subfamily A member 2b-like [Calidris pugnax]|uniref:dispanin subfamily A member 2b-like n=1 Tax=Calidris pugnax TaxID=198806 RepID=UPI00071CA357|nr:PREDICTED: dispanin subfamily A member 2b-like [Calidris pugnax]